MSSIFQAISYPFGAADRGPQGNEWVVFLRLRRVKMLGVPSKPPVSISSMFSPIFLSGGLKPKPKTHALSLEVLYFHFHLLGAVALSV